MKRMNSLIKVVALIVVVALCAPFLAACSGEVDDRETTHSSRETIDPSVPGIDEPDQSIASSEPTETTETSETTESSSATTEAPTGMYTYTVYAGTPNEMTLSMDVNIDDYILPSDNEDEFVQTARLASDLGWLSSGLYSWDDICSDPNVSSSNWYSYSYGDHRAVLVIENYINLMPGSDYSQISAISISYLENDSPAPFFDDGDVNEAHSGLILSFGNHYSDVCYRMGGLTCMCSRDDCIVLAYCLWCFSNNAENSMPVKDAFNQFADANGYWLP